MDEPNLDAMARMLSGESGPGTQIAAEIIDALAKVFDARGYVSINSSQISGVSFKNIGEAGLEFLESLRAGGARSRVNATLNPCGLDLEAWQELGFSESFYLDQQRVIDAYAGLGIDATCTCTPYLWGNCPRNGEHVAWSESSAISYVNSVLGARTNREGGPAALAAALTGFTGNYGLHLDEHRVPRIIVNVKYPVKTYFDFGTLGLILGKKLGQDVAFITGLENEACTGENLRQLGAAMAASGAVALYHVDGVTPEAQVMSHFIQEGSIALETIEIDDIEDVADALPSTMEGDGAAAVDLVFLGCPHYSRQEVLDVIDVLRNKVVKATIWIATARSVKKELLEDPEITSQLDSHVKIIADTCIVVCPVDELGIRSVVTNSGKAFFYLRNNENLAVLYRDTSTCIEAAISGMIAINKEGDRHAQD
ncbi:MAG TPA: aconitase X catalytic domain-containing protein [Candidatus Lokiarchaeia archaeon]|nr:aconitase X catalytic domain-containing protein [Candidatus Lokiarchaeia archaeon]